MLLPPQFLHFQRLGLRRNPFGSLTQAEEDALCLPIPEIDARAHTSHSLQLMGAKGRGKTSLLRAVMRQCQQRGQRVGYDSLPDGQKHLTISLANLDLCAVDEAQRLSWTAKHRLFWAMRGQRLLLTTHDDLSVWFRLYGLSYQTIEVAQFITPQHVAAILARRITFFALDDEPFVGLAEDALAWLWLRYNDDVRGTEEALYTVFQRVRDPGMITALTLQTILGS